MPQGTPMIPDSGLKLLFVMSLFHGQADEKVLRHLEMLGWSQSELLLRPRMLSCLVSVQIRDSVPPPFVLLFRGLAISANSGTQRQQYSATCRDSCTCLLCFGAGI